MANSSQASGRLLRWYKDGVMLDLRLVYRNLNLNCKCFVNWHDQAARSSVELALGQDRELGTLAFSLEQWIDEPVTGDAPEEFLELARNGECLYLKSPAKKSKK